MDSQLFKGKGLSAQEGRNSRVILVSLPWATYAEPSLGLAILKATLKEQGIFCRAFHANLGLLRHLNFETYSMLATFWGLNEFVFTGNLDRSFDEVQAKALVERCKLHAINVPHTRYSSTESLIELCMQLRDDVMPNYLRECANQILDFQPTMVGFTCMFDQTLASIALAKILKADAPNLLVVLGGYAMEGTIGPNILRTFKWIDAIARGDGESLISSLAAASVGAEQLEAIPGILTKHNNFKPSQRIDLNKSPPPDYDDWFADIEQLKHRDQITIQSQVLPVEASRGCWWGENKHCIFCGIDELALKYRAKSTDEIGPMLHNVRKRYGEYIFRFSDYILPKQYYGEVLDELAQTYPRFRLMGEIKANQNLDRLRRFAAAGFVELQPGIESFSSEVLRLMDKGVLGIHNVLTLKGGYLFGIQINYNILYGLPNEEPSWYRQMLKQIPFLYHFTPPVSRTETVVTRFAPLQTDPKRFGLSQNAKHHRCYDVFFSQNFLEEHSFSLDEYAYYFDRHFSYVDELPELYAMLIMQIEHWKRQHRERSVYLYYVDRAAEDTLEVFDGRFDTETSFELRDVERRAYLACDKAPITECALRKELHNNGFISDDIITSAIDVLNERRLVWREKDRLLGVAVPHAVWDQHHSNGWPQTWTANYC